MNVLFVLDIDPPKYMHPSVAGLETFIHLVASIRDFKFIMNFTGIGLLHIKNKARKLIKKIKEMHDNGQVFFGNHTLTHTHLVERTVDSHVLRKVLGIRASTIKLSPEEVKMEIIKCERKIESTFDVRPNIFKAPFYATAPEILELVSSMGYEYDLSIYNVDGMPFAEEYGGKKLIRIPTNMFLSPEDEWPEHILIFEPSIEREFFVVTGTAHQFAKKYPSSNQTLSRFKSLLFKRPRWLSPEDIAKYCRL